MQTEVLEEFIAVAKYSSFRKAADELHISPSALSTHISGLEREIGARLFERGSNVHLTSAGAYFYVQAEEVLDLLDESIKNTRGIASQARPIHLQMFGYEDSALNKYLSHIKTPYVTLQRNFKQPLLGPVKSGEADIVVAPCLPSIIRQDKKLKKGELCCFPIGEAEFSCLVSADSDLAGKDSLSIEDLRSHDCLVIFGNLCDWEEAAFVEHYGKNTGVKFVQDPSMPVGFDGIPLRGLGDRIMPIYRGAAHHSCASRSDLVAIDKVEGQPLVSMEHLAYRADNENPNVAAFVEEVRELVGEVQVDAWGTYE